MVRVVVVAWLLLVATASARQGMLREGSADWEDDKDIEELEGSAEEELNLIPDGMEEVKKTSSHDVVDDDIHFEDNEKSSTTEMMYEYYNEDETDEYYPEYEDYGEEYNYDDDNDRIESVLKTDRPTVTQDRPAETTRKPDTEIKQMKPPVDPTASMFETSHIFIMVGSALVSFGVVMLAFFMCRRTFDDRKWKTTTAYVLPPPRGERESSPIVKNYQRVPTTTKEFLQNAQIDMYRGDGVCPPPAPNDPLLKY